MLKFIIIFICVLCMSLVYLIEKNAYDKYKELEEQEYNKSDSHWYKKQMRNLKRTKYEEYPKIWGLRKIKK